MLGLPFERYIPRVLQENIDNYGQAFIDYMNNILNEAKKETIDLKYFYTIELIPSVFLSSIGKQLCAEIFQNDTERQKRKKVLYGIRNRRYRSTWEDDIKIRIDTITGLDTRLYSEDDSAIICGGGESPSRYWATMGYDGIDPNLGEDFIGSGEEASVAGNVYVDLTANESEDILDQIEQNIINIIPAYFIVYLGYTTAGIFTTLRVL